MSFGNTGQPGGYGPPQGQPGQPQGPGQPQPGWGQQPGPGQPPAQPGGQTWGQSLGNSPAVKGFDPKTVQWWRWGSLVTFVLWAIAISLPWVSVGSPCDGYTGATKSACESSYASVDTTASAWSSGLAVFAFILFIVAAAAAATAMFAKVSLPFPIGFAIGGALGLGVIMGIIPFFQSLGSYVGFGSFVGLVILLFAAACAAFEIMEALKAPKPVTSGGGSTTGQWGQPAAPAGGQWGQPAAPPVAPQQQSWGAPSTGAQPAAPQQQNWNAPDTGAQQAAPQQPSWNAPDTGAQPAAPQQQGWGQQEQTPPPSAEPNQGPSFGAPDTGSTPPQQGWGENKPNDPHEPPPPPQNNW